MKSKTIISVLLAIVLVLGAALAAVPVLGLLGLSFITVARSEGIAPTPVVESESTTGGYQAVSIESLRVAVGMGSHIPVHALIGGYLPDGCSQVEYVQQKRAGSTFIISVSSVAAGPGACSRPAAQPFEMAVPLSVVGLPEGVYNVEVNGVRASFGLGQSNSIPDLPAVDFPVIKQDIKVDSVEVSLDVAQAGMARAAVSAELPVACAQLGEMRLHRDGSTFWVQLLSRSMAQGECLEDALPFTMMIPLNLEGAAGERLEVNVNGAVASFEVPGAHSEAGEPEAGAECSAPVEVAAQDGKVSYEGTSFAWDPSLGSSVQVESCPAGSPDPTIMPGGSHPAYTVFIFPSNRSNVDFRPELRVYQVNGDTSDYTYPLNSLDQLKTFLEMKSQSAFWFDKAPLHVRQGYLEFQNGSGARALVQYMQDRFFYTNNGLTYEFNGLTGDGGTFISLRYPVSVPFLMQLDGAQLPSRQDSPVIAIPDWPEEYDKQIAVIEAYNNEARLRLEQMQPADGSPDLSILDSLVRSLQVRH